MYYMHKSIKIEWQKALPQVQPAVLCACSSVPVKPWLCCAEHHMKPPVLLQGTYSEGSNHSKERSWKCYLKCFSPHSNFILHSKLLSISLIPVPYLAGGVCSQCFAEGQNSQSPDCRSCYSPGGQSEFLLPVEDVENRECSLWLQHHIFPRQFQTL